MKRYLKAVDFVNLFVLSLLIPFCINRCLCPRYASIKSLCYIPETKTKEGLVNILLFVK